MATNNSAPGPRWTGEMLNNPETVQVFAAQVRRYLGDYAQFIAMMRRDAEAMWKANPPEGYSTFEAWWRNRWVRGPLREIQEHLEQAAALTHDLEARYRRGRHEIPAAKRQAAERKQQGPALRPPRQGTPPPLRTSQPGQAQDDRSAGRPFMELVTDRREQSA